MERNDASTVDADVAIVRAAIDRGALPVDVLRAALSDTDSDVLPAMVVLAREVLRES